MGSHLTIKAEFTTDAVEHVVITRETDTGLQSPDAVIEQAREFADAVVSALERIVVKK
jgi:hypothetical protein